VFAFEGTGVIVVYRENVYGFYLTQGGVRGVLGGIEEDGMGFAEGSGDCYG
jgi:hypothetical protein